MTRREAVMIAALSLIWGSSFMFIKVADRQFDPAALVFFRLLLATMVILPVAFVVVGRDLIPQARPVWGRLVVLGLVNTTIPFLLISWAETRMDSGLAAILQAAAPIFSALIATRFGHDPVTGYRLAGVLIGLAGVALLIGSPGGGGLVPALAVVLAAFAYACAANFGSNMLAGTQPLVVAAVSSTAAMIAVAPLGLARLPEAVPGWKECGSVVMLGVVGTGVAYIILFALLKTAGPSRTILITYLIPAVAVFYGVLLLGEELRVVSLVGLGLILAGVALASRKKRGTRERAPAVSAASAVD